MGDRRNRKDGIDTHSKFIAHLRNHCCPFLLSLSMRLLGRVVGVPRIFYILSGTLRNTVEQCVEGLFVKSGPCLGNRERKATNVRSSSLFLARWPPGGMNEIRLPMLWGKICTASSNSLSPSFLSLSFSLWVCMFHPYCPSFFFIPSFYYPVLYPYSAPAVGKLPPAACPLLGSITDLRVCPSSAFFFVPFLSPIA